MSSDFTQRQSSDEQRRAQKLSETRTSPPTQVAGYEIQRFLGSGAYGEVWVGIDQNTGRRVAIKFYTHRGGVDWSLLSREVEKLVFLSADRYVVQLLDVGWDADPPYYVMDYIENGSLEDLLSEHGPRAVSDAVDLFREVSVGLMHMHSKGVLHCDLKPANVLLDEDHKPRLADFGQSRLSHEQSPALGTLFYMAPEQADLEAVPDARWDVYALGALLYCMLTGRPPHRNDETVGEIESATDLADRLARYRNVIRSAPPATDHRKIPGVDRSLSEIVDRCLAADHEARFASVQSVIEALQVRDEMRVRRPLRILGIVGPLLLLLIMLGFGLLGYLRAMSDSRRAVEKRAVEGNTFAATTAAVTVARDFDIYINMVKQLERSSEFQDLFAEIVGRDDVRDLLRELTKPDVQETSLAPLREQFIAHPQRQEFQRWLQAILDDEENPRVASLIASDANGTHVVVVFDRTPDSSPVGKNYAWRTYFNGGAHDLDPDLDTYQRPPCGIEPGKTHISPVFQSTATFTWKVAISRRIMRQGQFLGVVAVTVEMGQFSESFQTLEGKAQEDHWYAVLVGARVGENANTGVILQHPLLDQVIQASPRGRLPAEFNNPDYHVPLLGGDRVKLNPRGKYTDPLSKAPGGDEFKGDWIAGTASVPLRSPTGNGGIVNRTGLLVVVQEHADGVFDPIDELGANLLWNGVLALCVFLLVVAVLWYFVVRIRGVPRTVAPKTKFPRSGPTPLHSVETLATKDRYGK